MSDLFVLLGTALFLLLLGGGLGGPVNVTGPVDRDGESQESLLAILPSREDQELEEVTWP